MSSDYKFVDTNAEELTSSLIAMFETITGRTVYPGSKDRLFISWVASAMVLIKSQINYSANQNIPSRAEGENLDALGELFYDAGRPEATASKCTMRFEISEAQISAQLIPAGTRVTDTSRTLVWSTTADVYIPIESTSVDVEVICTTTGAESNGYAPGQITTLVDLFPYYSKCENITVSDGGADRATDEEYYQLMRASQDAYSTAGPMGGYEYWAKTVSTDIVDVKAIMPIDSSSGELMGGHVHIFALMADGTLASDTIKAEILAACNAASIRPLTDFVSVQDANIVNYDIAFTYYIPTDTTLSAAEIEQAVENAVDEYVKWQYARLGRDINPSRLLQLLMETGVKRVEITSPVFTVLSDGGNNLPPDIASVASVNITNGGYEDE